MITALLALLLAACASTPGPRTPCSNPLPSPQPSGWSTDPKAITSYVASGLIPRYYASVMQDGGDAFVRSTATGATLATIQAPSAGTNDVAAVTAASDDRTFVVETQPYGESGTPGAFYLFHLSSSGRPGALRRLPVSLPSGQWANGIALSPDANSLAVATVSAPASQQQEFGIEVYSLATGTVRSWTGQGAPVEAKTALSWTRDERTLSFAWGTTPGARLLDLAAPGGNLLTASRAAPIGAYQAWTCSGFPVITPDGKTLACSAYPSGNPNEELAGIAEYSLAGGTFEHVLGSHLSAWEGASLWWENSTGSVAIGTIRGPFSSCPTNLSPTVGVFAGNRFIALTGAPDWFIGDYAW